MHGIIDACFRQAGHVPPPRENGLTLFQHDRALHLGDMTYVCGFVADMLRGGQFISTISDSREFFVTETEHGEYASHMHRFSVRYRT